MTITSGSRVEIIFPINTVFDIRNSKEVIMEIEKEVLIWHQAV
jgi:hypothetical protein